MDVLENFIKDKNIISISPFNHQKICNGVTWRIDFIVSFLKTKTKTIFFIMRSDKNTLKQPILGDIIWSSSNKYLHLFNPVLIVKICGILFKGKSTSVIYCHTFLSWFYGIFFRIFFWVPFIFDDHNVEFDRFKSCRSYLSLFVFIFEFTLIKLSSLTVVSSYQDQKRISSLYFSSNTYVMENFFEKHPRWKINRTSFLEKIGLPKNKKIILFYGSFDYFPNKEALHFIGTFISPFLDPEKYCIVVAGNHSDEFRKEYKDITCLGFVKDIRLLIISADLIIAPIFSWGGVKIKVLEALSESKDIITTSEGVRWITYRWDNLIIADRNSFLAKIVDYFENQ